MGELVNGRYVSDDKSAIVDAMMADAKTYFGEDLNDSDEAVIRHFYLPVATRLLEIQRNLGLILDSAQIEHASGEALDMLTALIGVPREIAERATGNIQVSLESADTVDHTIPSGTEVATNALEPVVFQTTDARTLPQGNTSISVPIKAVNGGIKANVGQNTIINFPSGTPFPGAEVTNPVGTDGGTTEETDSSLRKRAQNELSDGSRATGPALITQTRSIDGVYDVTIFINDTKNENGRGNNLPPHSFELVAATDNEDSTLKSIAQTLMDTKAVGDLSVTNENGSGLDTSKSFVTANGEIQTVLPNEQTHPVGFSVSSTIEMYVDVDVQVTSNYQGDNAIRKSIVDYLGGINPDGTDQDGELSVGNDVIHSQIESAIVNVDGVYDIQVAYIGTSSSPTGTSNLTVGDFEQAITDATPGNQHISITTTQI